MAVSGLMKITTFGVMIRRNSRRQSCNPKWREYDFDIAHKKYADIGCRPVYDIWNSSKPLCNSSEKIAIVTTPFGETSWKINSEKYSEPCQSADKIVYDFQETYPSWGAGGNSSWDYFNLAAQMPLSKLKVTQQKQAYDLQNLIGNSGGYIGLILGKYIVSLQVTIH